MEEVLPKNWVETELGNILSARKGKKPLALVEEIIEGYLPYILIEQLEGKPYRLFTNDEKVVRIDKNEVILVWDGSIGKCGSGFCGALGSTFVAMNPLGGIPTKFLEYIIISKQNYIKETSTGVGLQHINKNFFKECLINLPPLAEQERIVAKLDKLFAQHETIKKALDRIPQLLKDFRQQVLTQAVTGKLTEEWRKTNKPNTYSFEELNKYREEVKKIYASKNGKSKVVYKKSSEVKLGENTKGIEYLYKIPDSWLWTNLDQVTWNISDGPHFSPKYVAENEGKRFISMRNVNVNGVDFSDCKYVSVEDHNQFVKRGKPEIGDLLYTKGGSTGIACVLDTDVDFSYWVHLALLKVVKKSVNSIFLRNALNSPMCYKQSQAFTHGVGNQDLGLTRMIYIAFPLPPLKEQQEIVNRVESLFAKADKIEAKYKALKAKVATLPQAILHKAFEGELVPQLPTDGHAKDLLAEIMALKNEVKKKK
ncbi:restriction endonuclease subunit S [Pedobacter sp. SL55]|uniref:restriction endonuclease subunit S n=1 Tax=Pedobacter sp. SL55 TaxID=2995161 RepID=UPI00226ED4BC|nr:restriction endonuclease subunit S [Pedobacter sp. SL55]WAC39864.1 restriction endonuclease subunit S [Pedobacter sp. SL55]